MPVKRTKPIVDRRTFSSARVWRDDLDEVVELIAQVNPVIHLRADDYELDSVSDLDSLPEQRISRFEVETAEDPRVYLVLSKREAFIAAADPDLRTKGLLSEVEKIMSRRRRPLLLEVVLLAAVGLAFTVLVIWWLAGVYPGKESPGELSASAAILFGVMMMAFTQITQARRCTIYTRTRLQAPTFWQRKSDDVWITLGSNAASLIIGGFIGYFVGRL